MTEIEQYIHSYFGIPQAKLTEIAARFHLRPLAKGDFFVQAGAYCPYISFIRTGYIRIYRLQDGKDITQWVSSPGDFITDLSSFMFETPARWYIQALHDCELYTISKAEFDALADILPEWPTLEKLFLAKCFLTLEDRVFSFLSMTAEERFQHIFAYNKALFNEVPLHYLASMMGMTPETLSRIRRKLTS